MDPTRRKGRRRVAFLHPKEGYRRPLFSEGARFSPDGGLIAEQVRPYRPDGKGRILLRDKELLVWDLKRPRAPIARFKVAPPEVLFSDISAQSYAFSPDGRTLAVGRSYDRTTTDVGDDVEILLWDTRRRRTRATIRLSSYAYSLAFNPTGTLLAVGLEDRVELWRLPDRTRVETISNVRDARQLAFTPDGDQLLVAGTDGVQLWDLNPVATSAVSFPGVQGRETQFGETAFALRPDGRTLAVADGGQAVVLWNLTPARWRRHLCRIIDRDFTPSERTQFLPEEQRSEHTCPER